MLPIDYLQEIEHASFPLEEADHAKIRCVELLCAVGYRLMEWLAFINSEVHKNFGPLFNPEMPAEVKDYYRKRVLGRVQWLEQQLEGKHFVMGDVFTVIDAYLFVVANWGKYVAVELSCFKNLQSVLSRISERPAVRETLKAEGLA